jgi:hypothetical protein
MGLQPGRFASRPKPTGRSEQDEQLAVSMSAQSVARRFSGARPECKARKLRRAARPCGGCTLPVGIQEFVKSGHAHCHIIQAPVFCDASMSGSSRICILSPPAQRFFAAERHVRSIFCFVSPRSPFRGWIVGHPGKPCRIFRHPRRLRPILCEWQASRAHHAVAVLQARRHS